MKKGFTIIELLVVIAIISLLAAIITPSCHRGYKQAYYTTTCVVIVTYPDGTTEQFSCEKATKQVDNTLLLTITDGVNKTISGFSHYTVDEITTKK